jgi:hypothetical protein
MFERKVQTPKQAGRSREKGELANGTSPSQARILGRRAEEDAQRVLDAWDSSR